MLMVTFAGRAAIPGPTTGTGYSIWSYRVDTNNPGAGGRGNLTPGQRIAIGLPRRADVRGPEQYPGVPQLEGAFVLRDATSGRVYAGRQITSPGPRTISFVVPSVESSYEVLMAKAPQGQSPAAVPFLAEAGTTRVRVEDEPAGLNPALGGQAAERGHGHLPEVEDRIDQPLRPQAVPRGEHLTGDRHGAPPVAALTVGGGAAGAVPECRHAFTEPGAHVVTERVSFQREGDPGTPCPRIGTLALVRVMVG